MTLKWNKRVSSHQICNFEKVVKSLNLEKKICVDFYEMYIHTPDGNKKNSNSNI